MRNLAQSTPNTKEEKIQLTPEPTISSKIQNTQITPPRERISESPKEVIFDERLAAAALAWIKAVLEWDDLHDSEIFGDIEINENKATAELFF
mmetsp:Transcript_52635/g.79881  ORF Transcript_52635/g.79881 Transcript_52635/m.79881 type:complete len:93 (+) Transcript_52635:1-279(+)